MDAIRPLTKDKMIIAEDLGIIDDDVKELLKYSGFPGMAVLQFGFDGDPDNYHLPHNYPENIVAFTGTHDNNTLFGYCWEVSEDEKRFALEYLGDPKDPLIGTLCALWRSKARRVIVPVQDLLGYGADTRINTPGTVQNNWQVRFTSEQINGIDWPRFKRFNKMFAR